MNHESDHRESPIDKSSGEEKKESPKSQPPADFDRPKTESMAEANQERTVAAKATTVSSIDEASGDSRSVVSTGDGRANADGTGASLSTDQPVAAATTSQEPPPAPENLWLNLGLNAIVPSILMTKGKDWFGMSPHVLLVVALAFPLTYGLIDFFTRRKFNIFSVIGFVSILLTGGVGLLELDKDWIAVKEAAIPALLAIAIGVSLKTPFPLIRTLLYNPQIFDVPKVEAALKERQREKQFDGLMVHCTLYLMGAFVLSAILNYGLAKYFIRSETGTDAFVEEMGKVTAWSWPVITLPSMAVMMVALMKLLSGIKEHTGYEMEEVLVDRRAAAKIAAANAEADARKAEGKNSERRETDEANDETAGVPEGSA